MKISLNWLKDYIDLSKYTAEFIADTLTSLGLEVEGVESLGVDPSRLEGVVVGEVIECGKHPEADRLSLTKVDVGNGTPLSIVCGAPNVASGQKVLVATVGTRIYLKTGDSFIIKKSKIRGAESEGMICAQDELGLGEDHSGIMVLPSETAVGKKATEVLTLDQDTVFEIGLTPNRSDATNHLGVAHDLAAFLQINYDFNDSFHRPDITNFNSSHSGSLPVQVNIENEEACPRYSGISIEGIQLAPSPDWLKKRLEAIGVKSINNVVDITNFVLHETGQPLHAFDLDKIGGKKIVVKTLHSGTSFLSLKKNEAGENIRLTLSDQDLMICDGEGQGMCIAGVIGNPTEGVSDSTINIFLESAHFHPKWIRRTSFRHDTRTDAAKTFEKGTDPNGTVYALQRAASLICELAHGKIASELIDIYPNPIPHSRVEVRYEKVEDLIGEAIPAGTIRKVLAALNMTVVSENDRGVTVDVPTNKADVLREVDVIEEILRIYGYDRVALPEQIKLSMPWSDQVEPYKFRNQVASQLTALGFSEMMGLSLSESAYFPDIFPVEKNQLIYIQNTSNVHLDCMRPTLVMSMLEAIVHNQNRQQTDLRLFEFGHTYYMSGDEIVEKEHLSIALTGRHHPESWHGGTFDLSFYTLKGYVNQVLEKMGIQSFQSTTIENQIYLPGLKYHRGDLVLVEFGKIKPGMSRRMDIRQPVWFADFHWDTIMAVGRKNEVRYKEITRFPTVRRDLALVIDKKVQFDDILKTARQVEKHQLKEINLFDVFDDESKLGEGKKSYAVSFIFENIERTLQEQEVENWMSKLIIAFEKQLGAIIRR